MEEVKEEKRETVKAYINRFKYGDEQHEVVVAFSNDKTHFQFEFTKINKDCTLRQSTAIKLSVDATAILISMLLKQYADVFVDRINPKPPPAPAQAQAGGEKVGG